MGRYDALTELEEHKEKKTTKKLNTEVIVEELKRPAGNDLKEPAFFPTNSRHSPPPEAKSFTIKNPEFMNSGKPENAPSPLVASDKPEKYSTLLHSPLIKKLKLRATEMDIKDYEVLEIALNEYFEKHP